MKKDKCISAMSLLLMILMGFQLFAQKAFDGKVGKTMAGSIPGKAPMPPSAKGKPNVIWIMIDDAGYGSCSAFGGGPKTPVLEGLANSGLIYTNFHTTGVCSPSRAAVLTGRNHHNVGMGILPQKLMAAEFPGYTGRMDPKKDGTIGTYMRARGYSTYWLGKSHLVPDEESTDLGPFDRWPSAMGFDHYFGFLYGAVDQYKTPLVEDNKSVKSDGRHLNIQLVDKAIQYIDHQQKLAPERPFFMFFAPGATHSPLQVDREWIEKYKGQFDEGWDVYRQKTFERQKKLGVIPNNAKLPARNPRVPEWNSLSADEKKVYARFMEAYAGFFEETDYEIGRLLNHLKEKGLYENTIIMYMVGDNGGDVGGGHIGGTEIIFPKPLATPNEERFKTNLAAYDKIGTAEAFTEYPIGWSQATNTPYRDWKTQPHSEGGTRNPLVISWPAGLKEKGGIRSQYSHLIDLLPTTLELVDAKVPDEINGVKQTPIQGTSLVYSFDNANAPSRHTSQYYFLYGSGSIYHDGWKASFDYRPDYIDIFHEFPQPMTTVNKAGKEVWQLYNVNEDPTELNDLAKSNPAKLKELQALFDSEAKKNKAYPLINWSDLLPGFIDFQRKAGLLPPDKAPK